MQQLSSEDALSRSERRYRDLIEQAPIGVAVHAGGKVVYVNPATCKMIGASSSDVFVGRSVMDFVHPDSVEVVRARLKGMAETGRPAPLIREKFLRLDGEAIDVEVFAMPIEFESKSATMVIWRDVTRERLAEEALASQTLTRSFVRRLLQDLRHRSHIPEAAVRDIGRVLATEARATTLDGFLDAFARLGLGSLKLEAQQGPSFTFVGADLLEYREGSSQPTCHLALSFLESAVAATSRSKALGSEVRCQSRGHDACVFVVVART